MITWLKQKHMNAKWLFSQKIEPNKIFIQYNLKFKITPIFSDSFISFLLDFLTEFSRAFFSFFSSQPESSHLAFTLQVILKFWRTCKKDTVVDTLFINSKLLKYSVFSFSVELHYIRVLTASKHSVWSMPVTYAVQFIRAIGRQKTAPSIQSTQ